MLGRQSEFISTVLERDINRALSEFRNGEVSLAALDISRSRERYLEDHDGLPVSSHLLSLDLVRSLSDFYRGRPELAQARNEQISRSALQNSRVASEAALLSALELYSHVPLRRIDVEAGLTRLSEIEALEGLPAEVQPEVALWKAEGYRTLGLNQQAEEEYLHARTKASDPELDALVSYRLGELYERQNRLRESEQNFERAVHTARTPLKIMSSVRRAAVLRTMHRYEDVLVETRFADSLVGVLPLRVRTSARYFDYASPLVEEMNLNRTEEDRLVGSTPLSALAEIRQEKEPPLQLVSPFVRSEIALLKGSALLELGRYAEGEQVLSQGEQSLAAVQDTNNSRFTSEHRAFLSSALRFERAWSLFQQGRYQSAAEQFLLLAASDTISGRFIRKGAGTSIREQGRFADPFYEDVKATRRTELDPKLLERTIVDTTFFFYNDFPERSRFYAGVSLARAGKLDEAEKSFLQLSGDRALLYSDRSSYQLGLLYFKRKNYVQAGILLEPLAYDRSLSGAYASLLMGEISYRKHFYERARGYFTNALTGLPQEDTSLRATAHLQRGLAAVPLENWQDVVDDLSAYLRLIKANEPERTDEAVFWLAKAYFRTGQFDSARENFQRALREFPNSDRKVDAQYGYAWSLFQQNEFAQAAPEFERVIAMDSITRYSYDALARSGDAHYASGDVMRANKIYNLAVDRPAFNELRTTRALYQLGVTRIRLDSARSAMNVFNYLVSKFPNNEIIDEALFNRALSAYAINLNEEADATVERVVKSFPESPMSSRGLMLAGVERERRDGLKGAINYYRRIVSGYPASSEIRDALFGMQDNLIALKRVDEAIAAGEDFVAKNSSTSLRPEILFRKGKIQLDASDPKSSLATFEEFGRTYPTHADYPNALLYSGLAMLAMGDTERAVQQFTSIVTNHDSTDAAPNSLTELARIERRRGNKDSANALYQRAYDMRYFSSDAAPVAMSEHAEYLIQQKENAAALTVLNSLSDRYLLETRVGARAQIRAAELYAADDRIDDARNALTRVARARTDALGGAAQVRLAELSVAQGKWKQAVDEIVAAKKDYPLPFESEYRRLWVFAQAEKALGRKTEAIQAAKALLAMRGVPQSYRDRAEAMLEVLQPKKKAAAASKSPAKPTAKSPATKSPAAKVPAAKAPAAKNTAKSKKGAKR